MNSLTSLSPSNDDTSLSSEDADLARLERQLEEYDRERLDRERKRNAGEIARSVEVCKTVTGFIREAWPILEPGNDYVHGWHIDAIADHLHAVTLGHISRLIINVPPGTMKSLITGVFWPAWEWGPGKFPSYRYLTTSYADAYVKRDSRRMRDLCASDWYRLRWPEIELRRHGETSFENTLRGSRDGMPFGSLTGGRGDRVIIDDPHSTESAESALDRQSAIRIFTESVPTRLIKPISSAIVVIMQRLNAEDVTGVALSRDLGYTHLMLPMEFEAERKCFTTLAPGRLFEDPRTEENELLFTARFPREVVDRDKRVMGSYAVAGQFQQRPTMREGGLFKRSWFKPMKRNAVPEGTRWLRYWDLAATEEQVSASAAYTVGLLLGRTPDNRYIIADVARLRAEGQGVRRLIRETAESDGYFVEIGLPQDPGQAGKVQAKDMVLMLAGYVVRAMPETGDKLTRAEPVAAHAEGAGIYYLEDEEGRRWNEELLNEVSNFPGGQFKDQVDALSGAFNRLVGSSMFPTPESYIRTEGVKLNSAWTRLAALELDNNHVGIVWSAWQESTDSLFIYDVWSIPQRNLPAAYQQLATRGAWIPCLMDVRGGKRTAEETEVIAQTLNDMGANVLIAEHKEGQMLDNLSVRLAAYRLKVFEHLSPWFAEYRRFRRDDAGQLIYDESHLMRATAVIATHVDSGVTENKALSDGAGFDQDDFDRRNNTNSAGY